MKPNEKERADVEKLVNACDSINEGVLRRNREILAIRNALILLLGDFDQNTMNYLLSKLIRMSGSVNLPGNDPQKKIGFGNV